MFHRVGEMAEKPHFLTGQNPQHVSSARLGGMGDGIGKEALFKD